MKSVITCIIILFSFYSNAQEKMSVWNGKLIK